MSDFMCGWLLALVLVIAFLICFDIGHRTASKNIANECKTYGMATIDNQVYNCTLKELI